MKKLILTIITTLLPLLASADAVEINGICYNLDSETRTAEVTYNNKYNGDIEIPEAVEYERTPYDVTSIGESAFSGCSRLTSVTIPNSVISIGGSAFSGCSRLTSVTIPNSVISIGDYAFSRCSRLTSFTIPNSVIDIGGNAFNLTAWYNSQPDGLLYKDDVLLGYKGNQPEGDLEIKDGTRVITGFQNCDQLTSINIPNSVIGIGDFAFMYCYGLTSVTIPNSVTYIGEYAFYQCRALISITIPNSVTYIGKSAFYNCSTLTEVIIPNSVTSIGEYAFYTCYGLTSVTISNSVTSIEQGTFSSCSLTSVTIPNSVTTIGDRAFLGCSSLTSVTIPNSVTSIGERAFSDCYDLTEVISLIEEPFEINENVFDSIDFTSATLYVPAGCKEKYESTPAWNKFENIIEISGSGTGITNGIDVNNRETINSNRYYNLNGQRVEKPTNGIYIHDGKKIVIK